MMNYLTKERAFIGLILFYAIAASFITPVNGGDFDVFLHAANKLSEGDNIYMPPFFNGLQYYYSQFFALILIPFSKSYYWSEVGWSLLSFFLLYRTFILLSKYVDFTVMTQKQYRTWLLLTIFFALQFVMYNVSMIQVTFFLLWACVESIALFEKGRFGLGGVLLGFAINVKLMPLLILPYLFYKGYFKGLFVTIAVFVSLLYVPALFIGKAYNDFLLSEWWRIINPGNKEHLFEAAIGTHSIVAFIPVYLTDTVGDLPIKRNFVNLTAASVELIINLTRLFLLGLSLFFFRSLPFKKETDRLKMFWELSFFLLLIPLLMPHQQKYAFIFALPLISYILYFFILTYRLNNQITYKMCLITFIVCGLFFSPLYGSDIIGKKMFLLTQHYRLLTLCSLLLIPIALYCSPLRLRLMIR